jgi:hypothetical protein
MMASMASGVEKARKCVELLGGFIFLWRTWDSWPDKRTCFKMPLGGVALGIIKIVRNTQGLGFQMPELDALL